MTQVFPAVWFAGKRETIFLLGLLLVATGLVSTPVALIAGIAFGLTGTHPLAAQSSRLSKLLLQASVVGLGFGMNLRDVLHAGRAGAGYTILSIAFAMSLGLLLGRAFAVDKRVSFLITAGTAICGGSAIAALAPVSEASEEEISVSMGSVFVLNSVALLIFPAIGAALHFSQNQFGLWAALAIHDTSSVVGAAAKYGPRALEVGTTVKLVRALWIVPLSLATAAYVRAHGHRTSEAAEGKAQGIRLPWFILFFCLASVASSVMPHFAPAFAQMVKLGKTGLSATLYLIGTGLSVAALRKVGARPFVLGVLLWIAVGVVSAWAIHANLISL